MGKFFGTDGIRGIPWDFPFTPVFLRKIGYCSAYAIKKRGARKGRVCIGVDSRESGRKIKKLMAEGISANGLGVVDVGIVTTPCLAYVTKKEKAPFGIMISASHNPPEFNGIKIFSSNGKKISDSLENEIEKMLESDFQPARARKKAGKPLKKDFSGEYADYVLSTLPGGFSLKGVKICLDCSNGGGYRIAPEIFRRLGAELALLGNSPDGKNINKNCGALDTERMREKTRTSKAFCGISLDGDGDRCILSDEKGGLFDGDDIIALLAVYFKGKKWLNGSKAVLTVMSNYGLLKYLKRKGIGAVQVSVGDKNVTDAIDNERLSLGGEASGHIIIRKFAPSGDGVLSSLWTLCAALSTGKKLGEIKKNWKRYPQKLKAIKVEKKTEIEKIPGFSDKVREFEKLVKGRIFVRYSGTEPLLRILVEGEDEKGVDRAAEEIAAHYVSHAGKKDKETGIRHKAIISGKGA